jgi:hypothetical protein
MKELWSGSGSGFRESGSETLFVLHGKSTQFRNPAKIVSVPIEADVVINVYRYCRLVLKRR